MSQSMREMRDASRLTRMGRRLSLILSKESIFGSTGSSKEKDSSSSAPSSPVISPLSPAMKLPPLRRSTGESITPAGNPECKVFGVDLQTAVARSNKMHKYLPDVLYKCLVYLDEKGVNEEGVFRLSGSATDILKIKGQFNQGISYDLSTCLNPHTISGLFKLFLRELPHPLFPTELDTSGEGLLGRIKTMVEALPKENRVLMSCLFWLLYKVSKEESVTKMGIQNLVIVFSATLNCSGTILTKIIKHTMDIFPEDMLAKTEVEPKIDLSGKSISITTPAGEEVRAAAQEEDIFVVDGKIDGKKKAQRPLPPRPDGKNSVEIGRRDRERDKRNIMRSRTKSIFDSDDEDDEEIPNDLLVAPSQSLPVRSRGYFM